MDFLKTLLQDVKPGDTLLDIGANIGGYTAMMRAHCPLATIHAFEPIPSVYVQLVEAHGMDALTFCHQLAVGARREVIQGVAVHEAWTLNRPGETRRGRNATYGQDQFDMQVTTVDAFLQGWPQNGGHVAMMKIDTDGWDYRVLQGAVETIQRCRPRILIEFGYCITDLGDLTSAMLAYIRTLLNYHVYEQSGRQVLIADHADWYPHDTTRDYALIPAEQALRPLD